jgi:hypothetical protein
MVVKLYVLETGLDLAIVGLDLTMPFTSCLTDSYECGIYRNLKAVRVAHALGTLP